MHVVVVVGNHTLIDVLEEPKLNFWSSQSLLQTKHWRCDKIK